MKKKPTIKSYVEELPNGDDSRTEETLAIRDKNGNLFLIATKNLPLHQVDPDKLAEAEELINNAKFDDQTAIANRYEIVGTTIVSRVDRRKFYINPIIEKVLNIPSPTS